MSSKISGVNGSQAVPVGAGRPVQRPQDAVSGGAQGSAGANNSQDVQITGGARHLANLEQTLRDMPVVDETRVATIRSAIEQGTYTVRPEHVAERLLQVEHALSQLPDPTDAEASGRSDQAEQ